ncbi:MAG: ATP-dependent DNA helicase [Halobacteriales archaeon]
MDRVANALARGRDVLFEGACGTGKTLAALVPALEHARQTGRTVVITTNVHQQMWQFVEDARAITASEPIRAVVFRGKGSMCHIDVGYEECQVLRDNTFEVVDTERDLEELQARQRELLEKSQAGDADATTARAAVMDELETLESELDSLRDRNICDRFYANLTQNTDAFFGWLFEDVRTPDEIYDYAHEHGFCGYELLKEAMEDIDLVVCNYHHLLDPDIRRQFFRWLDREPEDIITVFDEAHNIERAARDHANRTLTERTLDRALEELDDLDDPRTDPAMNVIATFQTALIESYEDGLGFGDREAVGEEWTDIPVENEDRRDDLTLEFLQTYSGQGFKADLETAIGLGQTLDQRYEEAYRTGDSETRKDCPTLTAAKFIELYLEETTELGQYPTVGVRRDATGELYGRAELYTCIPRTVTGELFSQVHASVLMSATLRPFDVTADVLGMANPMTIAYGLQFPIENRRTFAVSTPALFASKRDDPTVQGTITESIEHAIELTPGNTLVFFPSYSEVDRYAQRLDPGDATLYVDEPGVRAEDRRQSFVGEDHAALLTSLWGTLTEGVSFDGDAAHTVVVVGVPYPYLDERLEAVQRAYSEVFADRTADPGWEYAVEIPTIRKTRQALGRVLRAPDEIGVRVLLDERYTAADMGQYSVRKTFPPDERGELIDVEPEKFPYAMLNFYQDHDAYEKPPPMP